VTPGAHPLRPVLNSVAAQLFVNDVGAACEFYAGKLGFAVDFVYGEPPFYGQVVRDNVRLALRLVCEPVFAGDVREREHLLAAAITVETAAELEALFATYRAAGVRFHQTLRRQPWGAEDFVIVDRDGNLVLFAGPAG
jgi:catechol 2,3-dioxygenase-like lactoylglutathione lyase family enzyme